MSPKKPKPKVKPKPKRKKAMAGVSHPEVPPPGTPTQPLPPGTKPPGAPTQPLPPGSPGAPSHPMAPASPTLQQASVDKAHKTPITAVIAQSAGPSEFNLTVELTDEQAKVIMVATPNVKLERGPNSVMVKEMNPVPSMPGLYHIFLDTQLTWSLQKGAQVSFIL